MRQKQRHRDHKDCTGRRAAEWSIGVSHEKLQAAPPDDPAPLSVLLESAPQQRAPRKLPFGNLYKVDRKSVSLPY